MDEKVLAYHGLELRGGELERAATRNGRRLLLGHRLRRRQRVP